MMRSIWTLVRGGGGAWENFCFLEVELSLVVRVHFINNYNRKDAQKCCWTYFSLYFRTSIGIGLFKSSSSKYWETSNVFTPHINLWIPFVESFLCKITYALNKNKLVEFSKNLRKRRILDCSTPWFFYFSLIK